MPSQVNQGAHAPAKAQKSEKSVVQVAEPGKSRSTLLQKHSEKSVVQVAEPKGAHTPAKAQKSEKSVVQIAELTRKTTKMHMKTGKTSRTDRKTRQNISKFTAFKGL